MCKATNDLGSIGILMGTLINMINLMFNFKSKFTIYTND